MANERRLIDSAELIDKLPVVKKDKQISLIGAVADVVAMVSECKPVDAVEVCFCKDCKYYFHYRKTSLVVDGKNVKAGWCQRRMRYDEEIRMLPNDFCSYGEKREVE